MHSDIKETAKSVNYNLMKLVSDDSDSIDCDATLDLSSVIEVLMKLLSQTKVPTKVAALKWISHLHAKTPNRVSYKMFKNSSSKDSNQI